MPEAEGGQVLDSAAQGPVHQRTGQVGAEPALELGGRAVQTQRRQLQLLPLELKAAGQGQGLVRRPQAQLQTTGGGIQQVSGGRVQIQLLQCQSGGQQLAAAQLQHQGGGLGAAAQLQFQSQVAGHGRGQGLAQGRQVGHQQVKAAGQSLGLQVSFGVTAQGQAGRIQLQSLQAGLMEFP